MSFDLGIFAPYTKQLISGFRMTIFLWIAGGLLAMAVGFVIALLQMVGGRVIGAVIRAYVELMRGTPLLAQLFLLYFGGPAIGITGGHGDINNFSPTVRVMMYPEERDFAIADGVDQIRHTIRAQVKYGVDVIKIMSTGGVLSKGDQPGAPQYTLEEVKAAVDEAHMAGRKIASHAHGAVGIKNAIVAGVDSVEHASLVDDEGIRLAKEHGTYFVMDIYNDDYILGKAIDFGLPQENVDKERALGRLQRENFEKAFKAGVKMAFGTDAGVYPHGDNAKQFYYMVKYGMSPAQAIKAATVNAADLLGRAKDVGTIESGKYADIIAVTGDPLQDVRALETIDFVMKGGTVYKQGGKALP